MQTEGSVRRLGVTGQERGAPVRHGHRAEQPGLLSFVPVGVRSGNVSRAPTVPRILRESGSQRPRLLSSVQVR